MNIEDEKYKKMVEYSKKESKKNSPEIISKKWKEALE